MLRVFRFLGRLDALESKVEEHEARIDDLNRQVTILRLQLASLAYNAEARIQATERCIRDAIAIN
jgi:uncharacterized coiled-coil protein SlyX